MFDMRRTEKKSELISSLKVPTKVGAYEKIFSLDIGPVNAGDLISFKAYGEVTNDLGFNVMVGWYTSLNGLSISNAKGFNVTPDMHHGVWTDVDDYLVPMDLDSAIVNVYIRAASSAAKPGQTISVNIGYGTLSVVTFRGT